MPELSADGERLNILDFGCGKSYLTFAIYYYLTECKKRKVNITGLDLKADVIKKCNRLAMEYGYEDLHFLMGDVADYKSESDIDMMVTLHACDTATDYAIAKAIAWNAKVILSVPCCQHELQKEIKSNTRADFAGVLRYGILRERLCDILTDAFRAMIMRILGFKTQVVEFVSQDATARNIMLKCEYGVKPGQGGTVSEYLNLRDSWKVTPWLATRMEGLLSKYLERYE